MDSIIMYQIFHEKNTQRQHFSLRRKSKIVDKHAKGLQGKLSCLYQTFCVTVILEENAKIYL